MKPVPHEQCELAMLEIIAVHLENISVSQLLDFMIGGISHLGIVYGNPWLVLTIGCIQPSVFNNPTTNIARYR
jgi:hypothetical protein